MGYLFLILTIICETTAVIYMKLANGFQHKLNSAIAIVAYVLGFVFLTLALKFMPVGIANAIWAGTSTLLVAVLGIYLFKEQLTTLQWISLLFIIAGLVGLNVEKAMGRL